MRRDYIGSVVALEIAILAQARGVPIDIVREESDIHGIEQAISDSDSRGRSAAAGGGTLFGPRLFCSRRTSIRMTSLSKKGWFFATWRRLRSIAVREQPQSSGPRAAARRQFDSSTSSTITMSSRTTKKIHLDTVAWPQPHHLGSGWERASLETTTPTDNEKFTLFTGAAFSLEIDSLMRCAGSH
jgi:hypothetical protein